MDSFELNKIAGAVLGTALLVMALSITSEIIYAPAELETAAYVIEVPEGETAGAEPGGQPDVAPLAERLQTADVAAGEASARKCAACHTFEKGGAAKVGPNLYGVVGNHAAHVEGFKFSEAMKAKNAEGLQWNFENLDHFLADPKGFVPGTAMSFAGLKRPDERANVIAYMRTLSDAPVPLPEASASEEVSPQEQPTTEGAPPAEGTTPAEGTVPESTEQGTAPAGEAPAETAPDAAAPAGNTPSPTGSEASPSPEADTPAPDSSAPEAAPPGSVGADTESPAQPLQPLPAQ